MVKSYSPKTNGISSKLRASYNKRKEGMKKKARELATLCGVEACVVFLGPEGELDSWPGNRIEVRSVFEKYVEYEKKKGDLTRKMPDGGGVMINAIESSGQSLIGSCNVEGFSMDGLEVLLRDVNKKLEEVRFRIEFVNLVNGVENYNNVVAYKPEEPMYQESFGMENFNELAQDQSLAEDSLMWNMEDFLEAGFEF